MADEGVKVKEPNKIVQGFKDFGRFLYNPDDKTVLGRGGVSWAKISLFYLIFYSCLAGFFAINMQVMMMTIDDEVPTIVGRTNKPAVAINQPGAYDMNFGDKEGWDVYTKALEDIKKEYDNTTEGFKWENVPSTCQDLESTTAYNFAGTTKSGCFFLGVNRIYGYDPMANKTGNLFISCEFDIGIAGDGDMTEKVTTFTTLNNGDLNAAEYYPWTSKAANGLQPLAAIKVSVDVAELESLRGAADEDGKEKLKAAFLKCSLMAGDFTKDGSEYIEDGQSALLTITYPFPPKE